MKVVIKSYEIDIEVVYRDIEFSMNDLNNMQNSNYNHTAIEDEIYSYWEKNNLFKPKKNKKKHFSIVIPPPNVTGSLHMGHALNNSLQDLLIRFYRMNGFRNSVATRNRPCWNCYPSIS